jgi:hypothetical protein
MPRRSRLEADNIPADHLQALGLVTAHAALLDAVIERLIWNLKRQEPPQGLLATYHVRSVTRRLKLLKEAAMGHRLEERIRSLVARIKESARARNGLVQGRWTGFGSGGHTLITRWNIETLKLEAELKSAKEIEDIAKGIGALTIEARSIIAAL